MGRARRCRMGRRESTCPRGGRRPLLPLASWHRTISTLSVLAVLVSPARAGDRDGAGHEHAARDHAVVRITDFGLEPEQLVVLPDQAVLWLNYSRLSVRIELEPGAATRVLCLEPVHFTSDDRGRLQAARVDPLGSASLCLLEPGTYHYRVEQLDLVERPIRPLPRGKRFYGTLVVGADERSSHTAPEVWRLALYHHTLALREAELARFYDRLADLYDAGGDHDSLKRERQRAASARSAADAHEVLARKYERAGDVDPPAQRVK